MKQLSRLLFCCLLAVVLPACAQQHTILFRCSVVAQVYLDSSGHGMGQFLGLTDEPIKFQPRSDLEFRFTFRRPDYFPKTEVLSAQTLEQTSEYPSAGEIVLQPEHWWIPLRDFVRENPLRIGAMVLLLAGVGFAATRKLQRQRKEAALGRQYADLRASSSDALVGNLVGPYRLLERLGAGGMGTVYRSQKEPEGEVAAVKVMRPEMGGNADYVERFRREIRVSAALNHPSLIHILDWGESEGLLYLAMELIEGVDLRHLILPQGMDVEQVWAVLIPMLEGLAYAHSQGVVHRDLKPENIMVVFTGGVRILDFGLARGGLGDTVTATADIIGSQRYMAPERYDKVDTDPRSDQFSVGIMAYEMLTGRAPFAYDDNVAVMVFSQMQARHPRVCDIRPEVAVEVSDWVDRLILPDPNQRFPTVGDALAALRSLGIVYGPAARES